MNWATAMVETEVAVKVGVAPVTTAVSVLAERVVPVVAVTVVV